MASAMDTELERFRGTWQMVRYATAYGPVPDVGAVRHRCIFAGDRVTLSERSQPIAVVRVAVNPEAAPKRIYLALSQGPGPGPVVARGNYEFIQGRLRLCIGSGPDHPIGFFPSRATSMFELERAPEVDGNVRDP